jgi:hypothetical protein
MGHDDHDHGTGHHHHHHDHDHDHDHEHSELSETALRVRALESLLVEKGYVDPAALDELIETYETRVGPRNGAKVVAKAWADREYMDWLRKDATAAIADLGFIGRQGEHMVALENTPAPTTWSCARCARVTRGRCWACRQHGTSHRPIARAPSPTRAACWRSSASTCLKTHRCGSGTRPPRCATW